MLSGKGCHCSQPRTDASTSSRWLGGRAPPPQLARRGLTSCSAARHGQNNKTVARRLRLSPATVGKWRTCLARDRFDGLLAATRRRLIIASTARRPSDRPLSRPVRSTLWNRGARASSRPPAVTYASIAPSARWCGHVVPPAVLLVQPQPGPHALAEARVSAGVRTGGAPFVTTCFGPRPTRRVHGQHLVRDEPVAERRIAARCCLTVGTDPGCVRM